MGYHYRPPGAFVGPEYQDRLALRLKQRLEEAGHLAGGPGTGVFARLTNRIKEAQRVVELASTEGYFNDISASEITDLNKSNEVFRERLRAAALEILADQYPELDVEVRFSRGGRVRVMRAPGETDEEFRISMRGGMVFRVFNRGVGR